MYDSTQQIQGNCSFKKTRTQPTTWVQVSNTGNILDEKQGRIATQCICPSAKFWFNVWARSRATVLLRKEIFSWCFLFWAIDGDRFFQGLFEECNSVKAQYLYQQDKFYDVTYDIGQYIFGSFSGFQRDLFEGKTLVKPVFIVCLRIAHHLVQNYRRQINSVWQKARRLETLVDVEGLRWQWNAGTHRPQVLQRKVGSTRAELSPVFSEPLQKSAQRRCFFWTVLCLFQVFHWKSEKNWRIPTLPSRGLFTDFVCYVYVCFGKWTVLYREISSCSCVLFINLPCLKEFVLSALSVWES